MGEDPPLGYLRARVKDGTTSRTKLEPDPESTPIVRRIFRECLAGKGLKAITQGLNADGIPSKTGKRWGTTSVEKILHNETYTGTLVWSKRTKNPSRDGNGTIPLRTEGAWPALIDKVTFVQAQARLAARAPQVTQPREVDSLYLLSGIMRCGMCGAAMVGQRSGHRYRYYMCGNARYPSCPRIGWRGLLSTASKVTFLPKRIWRSWCG